MRIAVVSDIHGNLTAFEAVLADLRQTSPDLILHGGDLPHGGSSPAEIVDRIRDLGWQGVSGNTDEMLFMPESPQEFAKQSPKLEPLFAAIRTAPMNPRLTELHCPALRTAHLRRSKMYFGFSDQRLGSFVMPLSLSVVI